MASVSDAMSMSLDDVHSMTKSSKDRGNRSSSGGDAVSGAKLSTQNALNMSLEDFAAKSNRGGGKSRRAPRGRGRRNSPYTRGGARSSGDASKRVYVGNLSWETSWQDLKDYCRQAGSVVRADVKTDGSGRSRGFGIVEYETAAQARKAIDVLNETDLDGRTIFVREDQQPETVVSDGASVYVGNLAWSVSWQTLKDVFSEVGDVLHADVLSFPDGRSKGCGIVKFATAEGAERAIEELHDVELEGRLMTVREDREAGGFGGGGSGGRSGGFGGGGSGGRSGGFGGGSDCSVYVGNLPWSVSWQDLKDLCNEVGDVVRADVITAPNGRSKGFGIVKFATPEDAQNAINELHNEEFEGRPLFVRLDEQE